MVLLLCSQHIYSQQFPNIQFNYLTEREGLSSNNVSCIAQDEEGFIWIGTGDGLNRLDGYRVKRFYHNPVNENSLINNGIHQIVPMGKIDYGSPRVKA
jgi:ligand-binding sensor domain-containing protein